MTGVVTICVCGDANVAHGYYGTGECSICACPVFREDTHPYPLGLVVTS